MYLAGLARRIVLASQSAPRADFVPSAAAASNALATCLVLRLSSAVPAGHVLPKSTGCSTLQTSYQVDNVFTSSAIILIYAYTTGPHPVNGWLLRRVIRE
jgi:hypothetical protein